MLLAFGHAAFYKVIIARTLCGVIEAVVTVYLIYRPGFLDGPRIFLRADALRMLRDAFPLVLLNLAANIYHRIDQVMLHKMSGDKVLGPYVIAVQLTELIQRAAGIADVFAFSGAVDFGARRREDSAAIFPKAFAFCWWSRLPRARWSRRWRILSSSWFTASNSAPPPICSSY